MQIKGKISCSCGACSLTVNDSRLQFSLLCACEDCRQAQAWASKFGGKEPKDILYLIYLRSDISEVVGLDSMRATQLRQDARSTRIHCNHCYSCIAVDHFNYANNIFMILPDHCLQDFDTNSEPKAVVNLCDYPRELADLPSDEIPVFHTFKYTQERQRYLDISRAREVFSPPDTPAEGQTIRDVIASIGEVEVLDLEVGSIP